MALRVRDRGETWIQWEVYGLSSPANTYGQFRLDTNGTSYYWTSSNSENNTWYTVSNLTPNTTYSATAYAYTNAWYSAGSASGTTLSPPLPPSPSWTGSTALSGSEVSLSWSSVSGANLYEVMYSHNGTQYRQTSSTSINITGLIPNTNYTFYVAARVNGVWSNYSGGRSVTTLNKVRPNNWSWYTTKSSGGNFQLTAQEWNAFCVRVNEFRTFKDLSTVSFTQAISGNDFTASMFNQVRTAIGNMNPTGISDRSRIDDVLASHLNTLRDKLNEVN